MSKSYYFKDQNVFAEDLNNTENSRIEDVKNRTQALLGDSGGIYNNLYSEFSVVKGGIFGRPDEYAENKNLKVGLSDTSTLFIYPGDAIDVDGNHIKVETTKTVELGNEDSNYKWTPTTGTNYIKIKYSQSSGSVGTDDLGNQYYARYYDSYYVEIDGTHPSGSTGNPILLGVFTGLGDGSVSLGTLFDRRLYAKVITTADGVIIDPFRNPVASQITAADHIAAIGTGTPSPNNPHGLSLSDIGGSIEGDTAHKIQAHINGIIHFDNVTSTLNSFKGTVVNNNSPSAAIDFTPPSNALLAVGGAIISGSLPSLSGSDAYALAGNGTYAALVYKSGATSWVPYSDALLNYYDSRLSTPGRYHTTGHKQPDYYYLGQCTVSAGGNTLVFTDGRTFNTTHPEDIIADFSEAVSQPSTALLATDSLSKNLERIRYQIGIAIGGSGNDWNNATSKNTDGSNADSLHGHNHDNLHDIDGTTATAANLITLTDGSNADHLHTHAPVPFQGSAFKLKLPQTVDTTGGSAILTWTSGSVNTYDYLNIMNDVAGSGSIFLLDDGFYHIDVLVHGTPDSDSAVTNVELILNIGASEIYNQKQGYSGAVDLLRSSFSLSTDIRIEAPTNGFTINVLVTSGGTYQRFTAGDGRFSIRKLSDL